MFDSEYFLDTSYININFTCSLLGIAYFILHMTIFESLVLSLRLNLHYKMPIMLLRVEICIKIYEKTREEKIVNYASAKVKF